MVFVRSDLTPLKYLYVLCMSCPTLYVHFMYVMFHKFLYILCMSCPTNSCTFYVCHVPQIPVHLVYVMFHKFMYILCMSCPTNTCTSCVCHVPQIPVHFMCVMVLQLSPIKYLDLPSKPVKVFCELIFVFSTGCHCLFNLSQLWNDLFQIFLVAFWLLCLWIIV